MTIIDEEADRLRDGDYQPMRFSRDAFKTFCSEQGWEDARDAMSAGFFLESPGADESPLDEEFGYERFDEIVTEVQHGGRYTLRRFRDPNPQEELVFDYSNLEPSAENTVLAVMAAEKVFRLLRDPSAGEHDRVRVDANIHAFLQKHFSLYNLYFGHEIPLEKTEMPERDEYVWFSHLREESQGDDLTILAIRRK